MTEFVPLGRPYSAALDAVLGKKYTVLNHGYVMPMDYCGDWRTVARTARLSYQGHENDKGPVADQKLLRRLMREYHTSPFEMLSIRFQVRAPIFVIRQWFRHRTASVNEESARYSVLEDFTYVPEKDVIKLQDANNKQGRDGCIDEKIQNWIRDYIIENNSYARAAYINLLDKDLTRELARTVLNVNTFSRFEFKMNLHNLLHFLRLRMDHHAQWEIQEYARAMGEIVKLWVPNIWEAFEDYRLNSATFSGPVMDIIRNVINDPEIAANLRLRIRGRSSNSDGKVSINEANDALKMLGIYI